MGRDDTTLLSQPVQQQVGTLDALTAASPSEPTVRPLRTSAQQLRGEFRLHLPPGFHQTHPALCGRDKPYYSPSQPFCMMVENSISASPGSCQQSVDS